jgi:hypothetical protein
VAYLLKAGTVEPEKQPLLGRGSPKTSVAIQWFSSSHEIATRDTITTMEKWIEAVFFLAVLHRRQRKGNPVSGGITGPPYSWGYKYRDLALQFGGSRILDRRMWS